MAALITAFRRHPGASFLVLGCDYPFLHKQDIDKLVTSFSATGNTVCYSNQDGFLEPLLAIYNADTQMVLEKNLAERQLSLRKILEQSSVHTLEATTSSSLTSVDDPASYEQVKEALKHINKTHN
jgi:molybdopterin-guanine dinucleotide biosynthesis protein A